MRDAIVFGYDSCMEFMQRNPGLLDEESVTTSVLDLMEEEKIEKLIDYIGAPRNDVYDAIIEGVKRCYGDMKTAVKCGLLTY